MREIRQSGSEGGEPQPNAASLPLSLTRSIFFGQCHFFQCQFFGGQHRQMMERS